MERLHGGLEGSVEPAVGGDSPLSSSVAAADVAGAVIKLCLHLSLSLISWRGLQQQQGVPDSQTTPPRHLWSTPDTLWPGHGSAAEYS